MLNLYLRSFMVLALLFGLLFGVGMAVITYLDAPIWIAFVFALGIILLQYLLGPWVLQLIYKVEWVEPASVDPELAAFIERVCEDKNIPHPRFGLIRDGNPNAFTFGHYPGDARLVITTGLVDLLGSEERQAVVAHELGHIAHWDFVVMTIAAAVPLLLYLLFRATLRGRGGRRSEGGGYAALVGLVSYVVYIISHYIVLLLSRVREYYADQFAGEVTGNPDALSTALVKVAYGLASAPKDQGEEDDTRTVAGRAFGIRSHGSDSERRGKKQDDARMVAGRAFGIFDPKVAQSLALASAAGGAVTAETMESAMKWDLWNPWALFFELSSSHPLPAKRIRALERQSEACGQPSSFSFQAVQPESYWDEFLVDVITNYLPALGLILGLGLAAVAVFTWQFTFGAAGIALLLLSLGAWFKRRFSYRHEFSEERSVRSLIDEVKVSAVRSIPCTIEGEIIGRGVPGLFYSDDLVMQDQGGFIVVDYRQPIRLLEFIFGWTKAESLIGRRGRVEGWYRRAPRPYVEMRRLYLDNGETVTSYLYPVVQFFVYAGMAVGAILLAIEMFVSLV
ncbi:MAG: M48 family metalloprotease [Chloroflexia bacterium]|nr:M48 family metalloprotease [Chloroflexia bacterium]